MKNKIEKRPDNIDTSVFGSDEIMRVSPKNAIPQNPMPQEIAYQIVHDEAMLDGNARLNMATFVTTWMDEGAKQIMIE